MMDEATKAQEAAAAAAAALEASPMVDETISEVEQGLRQEVTVTIDEQDAVQRMRAEASVLGERLGLGNMQVSWRAVPVRRIGSWVHVRFTTILHSRSVMSGFVPSCVLRCCAVAIFTLNVCTATDIGGVGWL